MVQFTFNERVKEMHKHERAGLQKDDLFYMYRTMLTARKIDERLWLLNRAGKIPFVISCQGHEAMQVGAGMALERGKDYLLPYYRDLAMVIHFGMTIEDIMMSNFAKEQDINSGGRQMPGHYGSKKLGIVTGSSPVTTQVVHAAGYALAGKMEGKDFVCLTSFGEGSSNQGDFHEAANFAGVHRLPVIFFCENNHYAISTPLDRQLSCANVSDRAKGYGMHGETIDGNDPIAVYTAVKSAVERGRNGEGPSLIEAVSYRLTPHSSDDNESTYREADEVTEAKGRDSITTFAQYLKEVGVFTDEDEQAMHDEIQAAIDEATDAAEAANYASPESALLHVYDQ
ncbi:thiamine pyrophosphate-dependent dehydrogenase E1 component subunit alpha [Geomicrobium sp. JCM 19055]|uniref:thiamine pyrophosphate-dependent dehydrogenase E1 component subunit alpha n=1 Tax=Geomicrobium sp. JCM 19055 TaxID=1460649 RepID=UPI00045ED0C5|nr:thiamine pyrophosphate-dependent dehydrogenase E1 component subunit alpha [Geomicrobium sp. JCM 19055]GAJ98644.1 branched-chain alpha-keto acid dehydrogenase, E1 component, alpha subunit [Geomicrobium sp. JCM 19055]